MKKILLAILFCLLSIFTFANDWEFGSEGEHIIPLKGSNMSIKKEKITLKLTPDGMLVNVKFTFDNPTAENKIVGFVTPESGNGGYYEEENVTRKPEPLNIKNFKTTVNGKEVKSNVELLSKLLSKGVLDNNVIKEYTEKEKNFYNYVYYFNADFKQGENVVEHNYFYTGSYGVYERDFEYVVTTISKWKNKTVEDFEIEVQPGNYFVKLPYSFWKNNNKINWEIVGKGKMVTIAPTKKPNDENANGIEKFGAIYLKLDSGSVRYKTKNFSPTDDFYMVRIDNILGFDYEFPEGKVQGYKFKDDHFGFVATVRYYEYPNIIDSLKKLDDKDLDIVRNYPYALAGYDFAKKDLKDYFSQFIWYKSVGKNVKIDSSFNNLIKAADEIKAKRKK